MSRLSSISGRDLAGLLQRLAAKVKVGDSSGFDPSILRHRRIWQAADEAKYIYKKSQKNFRLSHFFDNNLTLRTTGIMLRVSLDTPKVRIFPNADSFLLKSRKLYLRVDPLSCSVRSLHHIT
jgi:hypothetical protein